MVIRATVGLHRTSHITPLLEQHAKVASGISMAARIRTTVGGYGVGQLAPLLQPNAKVERRGCVAALIGASECGDGGGQLAALLEQHSKAERASAIAPLIRAPIGVLCGRHGASNALDDGTLTDYGGLLHASCPRSHAA